MNKQVYIIRGVSGSGKSSLAKKIAGLHSLEGKTVKIFETDNYFMFQILKHNQINIMGLRVGSGLPNIQKKDLFAFLIKLPFKSYSK